MECCGAQYPCRLGRWWWARLGRCQGSHLLPATALAKSQSAGILFRVTHPKGEQPSCATSTLRM